MARYRLNTTKYLLKWPKKHQKVPKFNKITLSTLSDPPSLRLIHIFKINNIHIREFFKASALWADAFYKSKCSPVCLSVCLSVCPSVYSLLRYRLNVFWPPLPEVGCPICLEIQNPWGKVMERSGLRFEHFCLEVV